MQLKTLEYLIALEQAGSINKAAKGLYISQQGLRHALDALEAELGMPLFTRSKHGIQLTEAGRIALSHANVIAGECASMKRELADLRLSQALGEAENTELIVSPYTSMTLLSGLLDEPGALVDIPVREWSKSRIHDELRHAFEHGQALRPDGGGRTWRRLFLSDWLSTDWLAEVGGSQVGSVRTAAGSGAELVVETLFVSHLGLVCRADTARARAGSVTLEDVEGMSLACFAGRDYLSTIDAAWPAGSIANRTLSVSDTSTLLSYLSRNDDAGLIADELSFASGKRQMPTEQGFALVPFRDAATISVGMAYIGEGEGDVLELLAAQLRASFA